MEQTTKKLGFGLMRLPKIGNDIDIEQTKEMVDLFLEAGFSYFDTAFVYGKSEDAIRQALVERYPRDSFCLATKNAPWIGCKTKEDAVNQFKTSLKQTGAGYFDYYLLHNLGNERTRYFDDFGLWEFFSEQKANGLIRNLGFSFHSTAQELDEILGKHPEVDFVQLQINYADWEDTSIQSRACYETARRYNKPIVVMEPVKGGLLASPQQSVSDIFKSIEPNSSPSSWAVRFAADLDGVMMVLSGMSDVAQMKDNISYMKDFTHLSDIQKRAIERAREELLRLPIIPCTSCDYCAKVCSENIGISGTFSAMNLFSRFGSEKAARDREQFNVKRIGKKGALSCVGCGKCEKACPQHIAIREKLAEAAKLFDY